MRHDDAEKRPAKAINNLDGSIFGVTELVLAILRSLPVQQQDKVLAEFDKACEVTRTRMLNSGASDDLIEGFNEYFNLIRGID